MALNRTQKEAIARRATQEGLTLTPEHWAVLEYVWQYYHEHGVVCNFRTIVREGGFDKKDLYRLFPGNPMVYLCWLTGLSFPPEC